jgi:DHA3 family macrolide efflux protein-like MFS transporter
MIPMLIFTPIAGVLSDRYDRRKLVLIVDSLQAFLTVLLIGFFLVNFVNIAIIFSFITLRSVCQSFHSPTVAAITPSMVPKDKLSRINGFDFLFSGLIQIIGAPIGGALLSFFQIKYILWVDVITFFIALIPLVLVKIPSLHIKQDRAGKGSFIKEFKMGFKVLRVIPGLIMLLFIAMLVNFLLQPLLVLMPFYILNLHGGDILLLGIMEMFFPLASLFGALVPSFKKSWKHKIPIIFMGLFIVQFGYLIYAFAPIGAFPIIASGTIIIGFVLPTINAIAMTIFQTAIPNDKIGRVMSIIQTFTMVISPLGAVIAGPLSVIFGMTNLYLYCAILGIIVGIISYFFTNLRHINYDREFEINSVEDITIKES